MALLSPPRKRAASDLRKGVIWLAVGLGVMGALAVLTAHEEHNPWAIGLVPTLIGLGYLLVHHLERRKGGGSDPAQPDLALPSGTLAPRPRGGSAAAEPGPDSDDDSPRTEGSTRK